MMINNEQIVQAAMKLDFVKPKGIRKSTVATHFKVTLSIVLSTRRCPVYCTEFLNFETDLSDMYSLNILYIKISFTFFLSSFNVVMHVHNHIYSGRWFYADKDGHYHACFGS
jgi:hypothetical protein